MSELDDEFAVEVKKDPFARELSILSITHNGYQWSSFSSLTDAELRKIRHAIGMYLLDRTKKGETE